LLKSIPSGNIRIVVLENAMRDKSLLMRMSTDPDFNNIVEDLVDFTGLSEIQVYDRLLRIPPTHYQSEFRWYSPKDDNELEWFFRACQGYLFSNSAHPFWSKLHFLKPDIGRVLDYGAGIGNNVISLAKRGFEVDYFEINVFQDVFTRFRASRHGLKNITFISPFVNGKFDPIMCITKSYGAIILQEVLEHIPNYHVLLSHLIGHLELGGYIIERSPFDHAASKNSISIHLWPSIPLEEAMKGMQQIEPGIWRKTIK
jgi:SAM-dependent methyltransferase